VLKYNRPAGSIDQQMCKDITLSIQQSYYLGIKKAAPTKPEQPTN